MSEETPERLLWRQQVSRRRWCCLWFSLMVITLVSVCMQMILWFIYAATQRLNPNRLDEIHTLMTAVILDNLLWIDLESWLVSQIFSCKTCLTSANTFQSLTSPVPHVPLTLTLMFSFLCTNFMLKSLILVSTEREEPGKIPQARWYHHDRPNKTLVHVLWS